MTKPTAEGRTVPIMVRVTEAGGAAVDKHRGEDSRAEFGRQAIAEKVARLEAQSQRQGRKT